MLIPEQQAVASHSQGHSRVSAVPGAGKTTTMVQFILNALDRGVDPRLIRIVMFNRSAQEDFTRKLAKAAGGKYPALPPVRTFHAMGRALSLSLAERGHLPQFDPQPLSEIQASLAMFNCLKEVATGIAAADITEKRQQWTQAFSGFVDIVKAGLKSPAEVFVELGYASDQQIFIPAFEAFEAWRRENGRVTFADFLYDPCMALAKNRDIVGELENRVDMLIVDEFQDVNDIQLFLLKSLAGTRATLHVVGDTDQCIYEFRGAKPAHMTSGFGELYEHTNYNIPQTFRYGHQLALAAGHLISNNRHRDPLLCLSGPSTPKTEVALHNQTSTGDEIADLYESLLAKGYAPKDIVVLCRIWSLSAPVELAFLKRGIQHKVVGGRPVLKQDEIQALITVLHIANNTLYRDSSKSLPEDLFRLLKLSVRRIKHIELKEIARQMSQPSADPIAALESASSILTAYQAKKITKLAEALRFACEADDAGDVLERFVEGVGVRANLREDCVEADDAEIRVETVEAFMAFIAHQPQGDIEHVVSLLGELLSNEHETSKSEPVTITTMHRSKGLEWPAVIIPGLDSKHMPYYREGDEPSESYDESERRLLYVGMTRAKKELHMFAPGLNEVDGFVLSEKPSPHAIPSAFLAEMNLPLSTALGKAIAEGTPCPADAGPITPLAVQYQQQISPATTLPSPKGISLLIWSNALKGKRVVHASLGLGTVIDGRRDGLVCQFKDDTRLFPLVVAHTELSFAGAANMNSTVTEDSAAASHSSSSLPPLSNGQSVSHARLGIGEIDRFDDEYVYVRFKGVKEAKVFRRAEFVAQRAG